MGKLEGRVAIVTGGASGIGRSTALAFTREGAKIVIADINVEGGEETVQMIRKIGGEALFIATDVSKAAEVEAMVKKTVEHYGKLDCAFNNAGIGGEYAPIAEYTEENWDRVINVNLKGVWLCMKYEIPQMLKQGSGAIVNNSSVVGLKGSVNLPAYCASKHGILGLTKAAAQTYRKAGIRVNAVCPGLIRTPLLEILPPKNIANFEEAGFLGRPEDIAEAVVWLCSGTASFVTGHSMVVDGGYLMNIRV